MTTSYESNKLNEESGYTGRMQQKVYTYLKDNGPMTGTMLDRQLGVKGAYKRLSELRDMGMVAKSSRTILDPLTHRPGNVWEATGHYSPNLPMDMGKKKTRKELLAEIEELNAKVWELTKKLMKVDPMYVPTKGRE